MVAEPGEELGSVRSQFRIVLIGDDDGASARGARDTLWIEIATRYHSALIISGTLDDIVVFLNDALIFAECLAGENGLYFGNGVGWRIRRDGGGGFLRDGQSADPYIHYLGCDVDG